MQLASVLMAFDFFLCSKAWAQAAPRPPANALPTAPKTEYGAAVKYDLTSGSSAQITQAAPTNIVSWKSFDIGSAASVKIVQPSSTAVLLNKVDGGASLNKTTIDGMLNANGRVYIYNPNGVVFGKTAVVNADTLIASSLKFDEARVIGGLLQPGSTPVLGADPTYSGGIPGDVRVEGDASGGAKLSADSGGLILLAAPIVVNNGVLNAPDGQVMLAAGSKVYLAAPQVSQTGTSLRGLLVEVSNDSPGGAIDPTATKSTLRAENGEAGQIAVGRGNATMIGYAVNQKGIVSATTSVNLNGSIYLYARDQAVRADANGSWQASRTGALVLGPNSVTQALPDLNDTATIPVTATFNKSDVKLNGADIQLQQNASIVAPGGNVVIKAERLAHNVGATNPDDSLKVLDPMTDVVRVDLAPGSRVDVSGSTGTKLDMSSNVINVDLRGTELADNVVLRNSPLYGTKVNIDIRKGTSIANIDGWLNQVQHGLGQLNAAGGTVNVSADGAIIQRAGSKINVDGGWVDYQPGYVNTTKLQLNDKLVDIGSAAPGTLYTAAVNLPDGPSNYEAGYRQGSSAGTVKFSAPILVQQGDLSGQVTVGLHQRDVTAADHPLGGQLQIGNVASDLVDPVTGKAKTGAADQFGYTGTVVIGGTVTETAKPPDVGAAFDVANADKRVLASRLDLDPAALARAGFDRITALTSGSINVTAPVTLAPGGRLWLGAGQSAVPNAQGKLNPGGDISFNAPVTIPGGSLTAAASGNLQVADGVSFDLAGRWVNDRTLAFPALDAQSNPVAPVVQNGGTLNLSASQLVVGNSVSADVSAGAWLDASSKLIQGKAGGVTFQADPPQASVPSGAALQLGSGLILSAYGFGSGGKLKLLGRNVSIGPPSASADLSDLSLQPAFFQQGGFTGYDIAANVNLNVAANAVVKPRALGWQFNPDSSTASSGSMKAVAVPYLFDLSGPARTRPAASVTLRALSEQVPNAGGLVVNTGAQLLMDPGASLNLLAGTQLTVDGTLNAPAGHILLGLTPSAASVPFSATRSIWFGPTAQVRATGSAQRLYTNGDGRSSGEVLDGGTIQAGNVQNGVLSAADGYVVAEPGALFDVGGVGVSKVRFNSFGAITPTQDVASSGGSIEIRAHEGLLFAGTLNGMSGGAGASGGSLTVALDRENQSGDSTYPANDRILTISQQAPSGGIVPKDLQPGMAIVTDVAGKGKQKGQDLGWFLTGSTPSANARHAGQGWMTTQSFASGGFGRLDFKSQDVLAFGLGTSDLSLSARDSLILDAPTLRADTDTSLTTGSLSDGKTLTLSAPYIQLGGADQRYQIPQASSTGNAQLKANATTIDLIGKSALQGFGAASLKAKADIRLVGLSTVDASGVGTGYSQGSLAMTGNLTLTDAQTYPTTLSDFTLAVAANAADASTGVLSFASNGNTPAQVLSAGGSLTAVAPHIIQAGQVVAPFGSITLGNLDGTSQPITTADLAYAPGSVTSVAGSGVVPFGSVTNGSVPTASDWQYALSDGTLVSVKLNPAAGGSLPERALPAKSIVSHAQTITANGGSVQNLSGGGSLFAYEFTPGKGGSKDVLANNSPGSKTTVFAINPNFRGSVAPIDGQYGSDGGLSPGDSVYLSGMPGLPAGTYTLLPAHYALLPGGYSVSVAPNARDMQAGSNITLPDGSMLVSGRLIESGSGTGSIRSNGFIVSSGSVVRSKSDFTPFDATTYFTAKADSAGVAAPERPIDGGYVAFDVVKAGTTTPKPLVLNSTIKLGAGDNGRAGNVDISAPQIVVVSNSSQSVGNAVKLVAGNLDAMGADSLLLGGLRDTSNGGMHLTVGAKTVTLSNDATNPLSGPAIVIAASDSVTLDAGASVQGAGTLGRSQQDLSLAGSGALLQVSSGSPVSVVRTNPSTLAGKLNIGSDATVAASGSAYLDGTRYVILNGQLNLPTGGALGIGAPGISLGSAIPAGLADSVLQFGSGTSGLAQLNGLSQLAFNSYASPVDLWGTVNLGSAAMHLLSFKGAGFQALGSETDSASRQASFTADTVRFDGAATSADPSLSITAPGKLAVQANTIDIGDKAFAIRGYANTVLNARGQTIALGTAGQLVADNNLTLAAGRITTAGGAAATFKAGHSMTLTQVTDPLAPANPAGLGGQLSFDAASIASDAQILAPSGKVTLAAPNGVNVTGGLISVAGSAVDFGSTTRYAPGGTIALSGGPVTVGNNAVLDLSAVGAVAGLLSISANNADGSAGAQLSGTLKAYATAGADGVVPTQGQFSLDADQAVGQFGTLNAQLNDAGFTESRRFRFRNGDVALGGNDKVTAHEVVIAADNGNIAIGGAATIDASGTKGGSIELYASQAAAGGNAGKVTLRDHARLVAVATTAATSDAGSTGNGGRVVIGTANADGLAATGVDGGGSINLQGGSIDVAGSSAARNGIVTLRAPRVEGVSSIAPDGTVTRAPGDVAIASLKTDIRNSSAAVIEAYKVYQGSTISEAADSDSNLDATMNGRMYADASSFSADRTGINQRLAADSIANLSLRPAIEVRAARSDLNPHGDLTVSVNEFATNAADRGWNLNAWRVGGAPVTLTLRAAGDLNILGSVSDGFVKPVTTTTSSNATTTTKTDAVPTGTTVTPGTTVTTTSTTTPTQTTAPATSTTPAETIDTTTTVTTTISKTTTPTKIVTTTNITTDTTIATTLALGMPDWALDSGVSASYRLAGGADLAAANPLAVNAGAGDVHLGFANRTPTSVAPLTKTDAPAALVRTGTGRIDVAAGRDVTLDMAKFFVNHSSDASIDGTPVIYDAANADGSYKVSVYGASLYTVGQATNAADASAFTAPQNALNTHFGAAPTMTSSAAFGSGGGGVTVYAGRDVSGPHNLGSDWFYRNADGQAAVPADPTTKPPTPAIPGVPGTVVMLPASVPQLVDNWLFRQGRSYVDAKGNVVFEVLGNGQAVNTAWWSRHDYFDQGIATLGGGDVRITAAGNVTDLSASVATSAYMPGSTPTALRELGGGDLVVRVGGDIRGGAFYVQKGDATLRADGSVTAGNYVPTAGGLTTPLNPVLALGDARVDATAGRNLAIETAFNPTLTEQSVNNVVAGDQRFGPIYGIGGGGARWDVTDGSQDSVNYRQKYAQFSNFSTYGADSAVKLTAVGGKLLLANGATKLSVAGANDIPNNLGGSFPDLYVLEPAKFSAAALSGDLSSLNGFALMPSPRGQFDLLAAGTVRLSNGSTGGIRMLDNDPNAMSNINAPRVLTQTDLNVMNGTLNGISAHVLGGLHSGDPQPARIVALTGDIIGDSSQPTTVSLAKVTQIQAGRDIRDLGFSIQQNSPSDVSTVVAGRDFIDTTQAIGISADPSPVKGVVTGPGRIDISAGRNVDLGNSSGVVTRGNLDNPYLPIGGAGINVVAGGGQPDYASAVNWITKYGSVYAASTSPTTLTPPEQNDLIAYVRSLQPNLPSSLTPADALTTFSSLSAALQTPFLATHQSAANILALVAFVRERNPGLSATASAEATWAAFRSLPITDQNLFLASHQDIAARLAAQATQLVPALAAGDKPQLNASFFSSLAEVATASKQNDLANFDGLIASLFPAAATARAGDISVFGSQIKTEQGGAIDLFAPTGSVFAGLTTGISGKSPSNQGIFTIRGGAIDSLVKNDFLVNLGRVFTLGGGDITLVSQYADIDAGRGAKTAVSAPPPLITIDPNGNVKVDVSSSISGSGIATLKTHPDQPKANVNPIAPRGIVDAGDAGIRSSGSVNIVANVVLNANNITAAGTISGTPAPVAAPNLGIVAPPGAEPKSDDVTRALSNAAPSGANASLSVEVLGYGDRGEPDADASDGDSDGTGSDEARKKSRKK